MRLTCGTVIGIPLYQNTLKLHEHRTNAPVNKNWTTFFSYIIANGIIFAIPTPVLTIFSKTLSDKYNFSYLTSTNFAMSVAVLMINLLCYLVGINDVAEKFKFMWNNPQGVLIGLLSANVFNSFLNYPSFLSYFSINSLTFLLTHSSISGKGLGLALNKRMLLTYATYYLAGYIATSLSPQLSILSFISNPNDVYKLVVDAAQRSEENQKVNKLQIFLEKSHKNTTTSFFNSITQNKGKILAGVGVGIAAFGFFSLSSEQGVGSRSIIPTLKFKGV